MSRSLAEGLYEHLITRAMDGELSRLVPPLEKATRALDGADLPRALARHVAREVERVLEDCDSEEQQLAIAQALLRQIDGLAAESAGDERYVAEPAQLLEAIYRTVRPDRPKTPLSTSTLLTRAKQDPALYHELSTEIASADEVLILSAFITQGGVRTIAEALERASRRNARVRVLTTVFTGTTEIEALERLARLPGAEVRVSYDTRRTRLHAKAWLFRRESGLHSAYVGSANLTATGLGTGLEWMMKVCAADLPHVIDKFAGTFEGLWNDGEFEYFDPSSAEHRAKLEAALLRQTASPEDGLLPFFTLRPFPFQEEILDRLAVERTLHGRRRNLVVAATGTGKTMIAAFDYLRQYESTGLLPRLLFVAHRRELLKQARDTYRQVLRDASFGELWTDGESPARWDHVFATIQTAAGALARRVARDHFRIVVIDECHHAAAKSYRPLLDHLEPDLLLGLTATPERADGESLLPDFDGRIAAELRLWHALERQLLVPFEYYGVSDGTDLRTLRWNQGRYANEELEALYTGHERRVDLVVEQLRRRVASLRSMRALAFCVSVEHAKFMARALEARGIPALAVHGGTDAALRSEAPRKLETREVNVLCTCDLYNEGVDLPFVDTLLLLRPTSSAALFMQQLGRGLRLHPSKSACLVLDFIGQHRAEFRFDQIYSSLSGVPKGKLEEAVEDAFPFLPSGCVLQLDAEVTRQVLETLKRAVATAKVLEAEVRAHARDGAPPALREFLEETGRTLEDIYRRDRGWASLCADAGVTPDLPAEARDVSARLGRILHIDERTRLRELAAPPEQERLTAFDRRRLAMLDFQLDERGEVRDARQTIARVYQHPELRRELEALTQLLDEQVPEVEELYPVSDWPLALHRHYERREIFAAVGYLEGRAKKNMPMSGILMLKETKRELLLVTLDKSAASFSPTTSYKDYAISRELFHWETQSVASVSNASGRRYLESPGNGWRFSLFVRTDKEAPYAFLGPVRYVSHAGDRPIAITWRLEHRLSAALFERFASLEQG